MRTIIGGSLVGAVALAMITAGSANAADTTVTFTVTGAGGLTISAPASKSLGSAAPGATITSLLGAVTVTDGRALLAPTWTASVASTDFTTGIGGAGRTIADSAVDYWSGASTSETPATGMTFVPGQLTTGDKVPLSTDPTAFALTAGIGNNSLTFNPTLVVNVPSAAIAGSYSGTVTHSVA